MATNCKLTAQGAKVKVHTCLYFLRSRPLWAVSCKGKIMCNQKRPNGLNNAGWALATHQLLFLLRKRHSSDFLNNLSRPCVALKGPINLFPSSVQPQGEDESLRFVGNRSKGRFYGVSGYIWAERKCFWTVMAWLPFKLIRKASSLGFPHCPLVPGLLSSFPVWVGLIFRLHMEPICLPGASEHESQSSAAADCTVGFKHPLWLLLLLLV